MQMGTIISMNVPLLPDYIDPKTIGLCSAYLAVVNCFGSIVASSFVPYIGAIVD